MIDKTRTYATYHGTAEEWYAAANWCKTHQAVRLAHAILDSVARQQWRHDGYVLPDMPIPLRFTAGSIAKLDEYIRQASETEAPADAP
jgi:uncharacterized protein YceK